MGKRKQRLVVPVWVLAESVGLNVQTVRRHVREGRVQCGDLWSVVRYVVESKKDGGMG